MTQAAGLSLLPLKRRFKCLKMC